MKYILIYLTLVSSILFATKPVEQKETWKELDSATLKVLELIANDKLSEGLTTLKDLEKSNLQIYFLIF